MVGIYQLDHLPSHSSPVAFGFLGGKEVKERGLTNVGLYDRKLI